MKLLRGKGIAGVVLALCAMVLVGATLALADGPTDGLPPPEPIPLPLPAPPD